MSQNLSQYDTSTVPTRFKTILTILITVTVVSLSVSIIFDYTPPPSQQPLSRNIQVLENIQPEIMVNPLLVKKNIDIELSIDPNDKLLNWDEFRIQRRLDNLKPRGFLSVLQREIKFDDGSDFLQVIEFSNGLNALKFLWHLPVDSKHNEGFEYDHSLWTISGKFLQVSPTKAFAVIGDQIRLHSSLAENLGESLLDLSNIIKSKSISFANFEWDQRSLGSVLKLELPGDELYLLESQLMDNFDSSKYKIRDYALGDLRLKRVISTDTNNVLIAKLLNRFTLIATEFPLHPNLKQKYKLRRLFH